MHLKNISLTIILAVAVSAWHACKGNRHEDASAETSVTPDRYVEGDTLRLEPGRAPGLFAWIDYHHMSDTGLRMTSMPASGVVIHLDPMDTIGIPALRFPDTLMAWSPDRSRFLDIWSYNHVVDTMEGGHIRITGGGPEQIVALGDLRRGRRHVLMFNGTGQIAESADWLDNETFVIGLMLVDEATGERTPDIMLFNLKDSTFTDFRYQRAISGDSLPPTPGGFLRKWLIQRGLQAE